MTLIACIIAILSSLITSCLVGLPLGGWTLVLAVVVSFGYWASKIDDDDTEGGPAILISTITCVAVIIVYNVYADRKALDEKENVQVQCQDGIYWPK